jgi:hypothetical protein
MRTPRTSLTVARGRQGRTIAFAAALLLLLSESARAQTASRSEGLAAPVPAQTGGIDPGVGGAAPQHPLAPAVRLLKASRKSLDEIKDYEATFIKRERFSDGLKTQTMQIRLREQPFSVYLRCEEPNVGREILFVKGQNQNMLLAHEGSGIKSLVGSVSLAVDSPKAREDNRHPITDIGMRRLVERLAEEWELQSNYQECDVRYYPDAKIGGVSCPAIECSHPKPRRQFPFHVTRIYIDAKSNLPVRLENYDFPTQRGQEPPLAEEYTYVKIRTNVNFKDADFSSTNPQYKF